MRIQMQMTGARILIRDHQPSDLGFAADMWFDEENGRYLSNPPREHVDEAFQKALDGLQDSAAGYYLTVWSKQVPSDRIGTCCMFPDERREGWDIGYCVHKSRWRQGFGSEIVGLMTDWIWAQGGKTVTAEVAQANRASRALLERSGFKAVGKNRFKKYGTDIWYESCVYRSILEPAEKGV